MKTLRIVFRLGLLLGFEMAITGSPTSAQSTSSKEAPPTAPGLRKLTGDLAARANELDTAVATALKADRWDAAIARADELLALRTRIQGPTHFETLNEEWRLKALRRVAPLSEKDRIAYQSARAINDQAAALEAKREYAKAQVLFEKALEIRRRLLTDDHPLTANSYENQAAMLEARGNYAAAHEVYAKVLDIRRRVLTENHPDTAAAFNNLGNNLCSRGMYRQAQQALESALEISRRVRGDGHSNTAASYSNVAFNLDAQGKYLLAQPLYEKALAIRRGLSTDNHPDTALAFNNLAMNLYSQGKYDQAQPLFEKALEIRHRLLTDEHPDTAVSFGNLAGNLSGQGRYTRAQPLFEQALEILRRTLTENHRTTAKAYTNVATNLSAQLKHAEAQPIHEKALAILRRLLTEDHPDTAQCYNNVASNLDALRQYAAARPIHEKALELRRRLLSDDHPLTATSYSNVATNLNHQGKYAEAQPLYEKALQINRLMLTDGHTHTAVSYDFLASNLAAQGKYSAARDRWLSAAMSQDAARLRVAFNGLDRAVAERSTRPALAAVLARLGQATEAWQSLEEYLGRGLLDELAARKDQRLTTAERARLLELTTELERLDKLVETEPRKLDQTQRSQQFDDLKRQRALASIAVGEFRSKLLENYGSHAGQVAGLNEIQSALPTDAALVAWVDIAPAGPSAADPDGEHWGVVVRSRGIPKWVALAGTGPDRFWTKDDSELAGRARAELRRLPGTGELDLRLVERLRAQRLEPLARSLGASTDGLPPTRRLIVLPSRAMAGIPIEALLTPDEIRTVSYAPSATVLKHLRQQPRPARHAGLLAIGDPVYKSAESSNVPASLPDHGLLINMVAPGSNAATHGLKAGDVLLAYNGATLSKKDELNVVADGNEPIVVDVWRDGRTSKRELARGKLGVVIDPRPAPQAIAAIRGISKALMVARSGDDDFAPLPGTRLEVEAIARLFQADDRPTRTLLGSDASEQELNHIASSGDLGRFGFIHLATHGVIDDAVPQSSALILTQTNLPDPLTQVLNHKPVFDGRLLVREIQHGWELKAELVTLSACETALGRDSGGEGFVGFTQALLMSGARTVCLSLWKVDDTATALLMQRFYANLLGRRPGLTGAIPKADALLEAKAWLRRLSRSEVLGLTAALEGGIERGKVDKGRQPVNRNADVPAAGGDDRPYASPHYWAAFVLVGDPD
jgi:tetratricopeptide (TPR) repeat protein